MRLFRTVTIYTVSAMLYIATFRTSTSRAHNPMRTVVSFGDLKQAGLYFDRALPVAFRRAQGTGDDIVFDFPDHVPSRALVSVVFDEHDLSEPDRFRRIGQVLNRWGDFSRAVAAYRTER